MPTQKSMDRRKSFTPGEPHQPHTDPARSSTVLLTKHTTAFLVGRTELTAKLDDELQLLAMLIILCNAHILMQSPIKKLFFFTI